MIACTSQDKCFECRHTLHFCLLFLSVSNCWQGQGGRGGWFSRDKRQEYEAIRERGRSGWVLGTKKAPWVLGMAGYQATDLVINYQMWKKKACHGGI